MHEALETWPIAMFERLLPQLRMAGVQAGDRVLEIGCGWGALAEMATTEFGASITGVTLSTEQLAFAQARMQRLGTDHLATLRLQSADVDAVAAALDARFGETPGLFDGEGVAIDLAALPYDVLTGDRVVRAAGGAVYQLTAQGGGANQWVNPQIIAGAPDGAFGAPTAAAVINENLISRTFARATVYANLSTSASVICAPAATAIEPPWRWMLMSSLGW